MRGLSESVTILVLFVLSFALGFASTANGPRLDQQMALMQFQKQAPWTLVRVVSYEYGSFTLKVGDRDAVANCRVLGTSRADQSTQCLPMQIWPK